MQLIRTDLAALLECHLKCMPSLSICNRSIRQSTLRAKQQEHCWHTWESKVQVHTVSQ